MGTSNELNTKSSRGNDNDRVNLQLNLFTDSYIPPIKKLPSVEEQINNIQAQAEVENTSAFIFTQEMIDKTLINGSNFSHGKYRIYEQFKRSLSSSENIIFLKHEYGIGGSSSAYSGADFGQEHDSKGIKFYIRVILEFINIHKLKNKYESIQELTLNDIRSLNNSDIYSFIYFLAESQYKINSRVVKTEHLRTFFEYLFTIQHTIFKEPFKKINADRKIVKKLPNYLSLDEAKKMINVYANSKYGLEIRDNAIIHLFLNSGFRLSELKNLSIDDLDLDNGKFSIIGKGNKERIGYINEMTKKAIEEYLRIRDNFSPKTKTLFVSKYGSKMSSTAIEKIIKKAYKLSGINDENYCVHTLRHTCATLLYRNGTDIRTIQELLGHVQIDTTEIYTHLHDQEVMDAMLDHPLSQYKMANAEAFCA